MMDLGEVLGGTMNIVILALFYTLIGLLLSVLLYHLFDDCDKEWKAEHLAYQVGDIGLELGIIGSVAFWTTQITRGWAPIFPISKVLDLQIDTYVSGLFFAYAMFLFLEQLSEKVKFLYKEHVHKHIVRFIPPNWSVMKSVFASRKTNAKKDSAETY
jgi:hypothetical protein|uniref:Uncharacterized protein n=1 Tax=viral metagenome TaxID=1070528 RepID=A0A6C0DQX3_9ZZZZ